jgi:hypothetical protein
VSDAASPAEILRAVGRWSLARGFDLDNTGGGPPWWVEVWGNNVSVETPPPAKGFWMVSPAIALAVALLIESRAESVDVGRCPTCKGVRRVATVGHDRHPDADQISRGVVGLWLGGDNLWSWTEDCPACGATGRECVHVARLLLDAVPRAYAADERRVLFGDNPPPTVAIGGCGNIVSTTHAPGDAAALARLLVHADQLQADGDPLGELLSWALTLWTADPAEPVKREFTGVSHAHVRARMLAAGIGDGWVVEVHGPSGQVPARLAELEWVAVATSPERGHPHTAEAVAQLTAAWDRLTVPCGRCEGAGTVTLHAQGFGARVRAPARGVEELVRCEACSGHGRVKHVELRHQGERTIDDVAMAVAQIRGVQFAQVDDCTSDSRIAPGTIEIRYYGTAHESAVEIAIQARVPPTVRVLAINSPSLTLHALQQDR